MLLGSQGRDHPLFQSIWNQFPDPRVPDLQQAHRANEDICPREVEGIQSTGKVRRVFKAPPPCRHVRGGVGNVTACAGEELLLRAGAGAGRGAARRGAELAAAAWEGGRAGGGSLRLST